MTKISKKSTYFIKKPVITDYFVGTDSETDKLETVNYVFEDVAELINGANKSSISSYIFSDSTYLGLAESGAGYFQSLNEEISVPSITKLYVSYKNRSGVDLTGLFDFISANTSDFCLRLKNATDPNNFAYFDINSVINNGLEFDFNVSVYKGDNFNGDLVDKGIYFFDLEINPNPVKPIPYLNLEMFAKGHQGGVPNILPSLEIGDSVRGRKNSNTVWVEAIYLGGDINVRTNYMPISEIEF